MTHPEHNDLPESDGSQSDAIRCAVIIVSAALEAGMFTQSRPPLVATGDATGDVVRLFREIREAALEQGPDLSEPPVEELTPAVAVEDSVTDDYIVCLEDGKKLKMLKRHLRAVYQMSPDEYRAKWGLTASYPMVSPNYARKRAEIAALANLGGKKKP